MTHVVSQCVLVYKILGGCPFNGPLSVMKYPTRESPRRDAASPIKYNGLRVPQHSSLAEQQPVGPWVALIFKSIIILLIIFLGFIKSNLVNRKQ